MHCPVCGAESTQGLNYCKRCGSNLGAPTYPIKRSGEERPRIRGVAGAAWAMALASVAVTLGGLGIVFSHAFDLVRPLYAGTTAVSGADKIAGLMIAFGSLTVFGTVFLLMRVFSKLLGLTQDSRDVPQFKQPPVIAEPRQVQLPGTPSAIPSVTEGTTRNFDPAVYRDRES